MKRDFALGQSNELLGGGKIYDLHNHYDLGGIAIFSTGCACVWFTPSEEHGAGRPAVVIDIGGIDHLEMTSGVAMGRVRDLVEMGYKSPDDPDLDWLMGERTAKADDHFVFSFGPIDFLRVHGTSMQLHERAPHAPLISV